MRLYIREFPSRNYSSFVKFINSVN